MGSLRSRPLIRTTLRRQCPAVPLFTWITRCVKTMKDSQCMPAEVHHAQRDCDFVKVENLTRGLCVCLPSQQPVRVRVIYRFTTVFPHTFVHINANVNTVVCTVLMFRNTPFCYVNNIIQLLHSLNGMSDSEWGIGVQIWSEGGGMFTYQIQHRFNNVPVAHLSNLDQSDENSKFHFDIPDWNRWIDNPSREHHWTWAGRHHCLTGGSGDRSRVLPVTWRWLSVRERHRARHCHRCLACHLHASRASFTGLL